MMNLPERSRLPPRYAPPKESYSSRDRTHFSGRRSFSLAAGDFQAAPD